MDGLMVGLNYVYVHICNKLCVGGPIHVIILLNATRILLTIICICVRIIYVCACIGEPTYMYVCTHAFTCVCIWVQIYDIYFLFHYLIIHIFFFITNYLMV